MENSIICSLFEKSSGYYPNAAAVVSEDGESCVTYSELNERAEFLATIISSSCPEEKIVGQNESCRKISIMTERGVGMIVAIIAILKSGSAYVPIDPSFPIMRQKHIYSHSNSSLVIVDERTRDNLLLIGDKNLAYMVIKSSTGELISSESLIRNIHTPPKVHNKYAYVLYTSGSTGKPKGVLIYQESVVNVINWFAKELNINSSSTVLGITTCCFDISVLEMFLPLLYGAKLVLTSSVTQKDPYRILKVVREKGVTVMQATPTTYEMMLATGWMGDPHVDFLVTMLNCIHLSIVVFPY